MAPNFHPSLAQSFESVDAIPCEPDQASQATPSPTVYYSYDDCYNSTNAPTFMSTSSSSSLGISHTAPLQMRLPSHPDSSASSLPGMSAVKPSSNSAQVQTVFPISGTTQESPPGIAAYIADPQSTHMPTTSLDMQSKAKKHTTKRKPPQPWYCVSRPISEQTRDIKISTVNNSTSIYYSRLLQKCRSIVEFCIPKNGVEELNEKNIQEMNYNSHWGDSLPTNTKGNTIRVVYQNVHRSLSASDNPHTNNMLENLNDMDSRQTTSESHQQTRNETGAVC